MHSLVNPSVGSHPSLRDVVALALSGLFGRLDQF
jgi:hypothetical protein